MRLLPARAVPIAVVLPLLFVATAGCDIVTADFKQSAKEEWRRSYQLQPGARVAISNVNGKIEVEPATGNTLEVVAEKTAKGATDEAAKDALGRIEIVEDTSGGNVRIETKIQRAGTMFGGSAGQVHYMVRVPSGTEVSFSTVNGGVELSRITGRIKAEATNGGIVAREVGGTIDASTTNGGVDVELTELAEDGAKLECTNGGIRLRLPATAKATISASVTNGGIDFGGLPLETSESTRRRLEGRLNGGGPPVRIEGTNGGIRISAR